jgi:hypothetical protein
MPSNVDQGRLALAQAKFEPVAQVLDHLAKEIKKDHGRSAELKQRSPMQQTAQNVCEVRYSLRHPDDVRFALTFIVTGEDADLLLLQDQERSGSRDIRARPEQVDQHVYRLDEIDTIKQAVQDKIRSHLRTRQAREPHQAA